MRRPSTLSRLIPSWTGMAPPNAAGRELYALPARLGGLGIPNHVSLCSAIIPPSGTGSTRHERNAHWLLLLH